MEILKLQIEQTEARLEANQNAINPLQEELRNLLSQRASLNDLRDALLRAEKIAEDIRTEFPETAPKAEEAILDKPTFDTARIITLRSISKTDDEIDEELDQASKAEAQEIAEDEQYPIYQTELDEDGKLIAESITTAAAHFSIDIKHKHIGGRDSLDMNNCPTFFNKTWRSHKKAWNNLKKNINPHTTMYQGMGLLTHGGINSHSYCAMD